MCGIAGKYCFDGNGVSEETLRGMVRALVHRGPDSEGFLIDQDFGMGMRRLRIIDLETGDQPLFSEDGSLALIFNGEIYNFQALRDALAGKGHSFKTRSDTEVIVHAYEETGPDCLESLYGMFAFALWNKRKRELFLARDRFGIKPLYYARLPGAFYFASEIKALLQVPEISKEIDFESLDYYLALGYVPTPRTLLRTIRKLPPGHFISVSKSEFRIVPFWRLEERNSPPLKEEEYLESLQSLLEQVVGEHLVSDVPLGIFLSGGTDSSALVALASRLTRQRLMTFSVGFPDEPSYNELPFAREVARRFQTDHHEYEVRPNAIEVLPRIIRYLEEPLADPSAIPIHYLCEMARREVTVILAGEGGDEIFAGYSRYFWDGWAERYKKFPRLLRRGIFNSLLQFLPEGETKGVVNILRRLKKFARTADLERSQRYASWFALISHSSNGQVSELFRHYFNESQAQDSLRQMQYADIHTMLLDDLLLKGDKISMAHSLELRVPLLDHRLVEFVYNLPASMKLNKGVKKYLLKKFLHRYFPKRFVDTPKRGFEVPVGKWFRGGLRPFVQDLLSTSQIKKRGIFNPKIVQKQILEPHLRGQAENGLALFALVMLEIWHEELIET